MKISVVFGTRPEAIKLLPVILAIRGEPRIKCRLCVTAQHREMLDQILGQFGIQPDCDLNVMRPGQGLAELTARSLEALDGYLGAERPDLVLVQGDTTTVLAAALAAFYRKIPVGHVEAGLRTGNWQAPWPEEANRVLTSRLAALHFAPTEKARRNLLQEGVPANRVWITGNSVIDALFLALEKVRDTPPRIDGLPEFLQPQRRSGPHPRPSCVLITGHRRENFGAGFESICRAIADLAARFPAVHFIYPVHLNPNVREPVFRLLQSNPRANPGCLQEGTRNIHLIEPIPYLHFVSLMEQACLILTDSGGIQEEAPSLRVPVLVMRDTTERPEALETGLVQLVGTDRRRIVDAAVPWLERAAAGDGGQTAAQKHTVPAPNPYGDGKAARRIARRCIEFLAARGS